MCKFCDRQTDRQTDRQRRIIIIIIKKVKIIVTLSIKNTAGALYKSASGWSASEYYVLTVETIVAYIIFYKINTISSQLLIVLSAYIMTGVLRSKQLHFPLQCK